jgi:DsbC/DsbD-like thiol-disulfide interchange protein
MFRVPGPKVKNLRAFLLAVFALSFASKAFAQATDEPIKWALALPSPNATTTQGGTITLQLTATIDDGWHLYATTIGPGGPIPTSITVPKGQMFTLNGDITEPTPTSAFDPNFNTTLEFHLDKAVFGIPLKVSPASGYGDLPARVAISFQSCNDKFCLPPKQVVTTVQVKVVPSPAAMSAPQPPDRDAFNKALSIKDLPTQIAAVQKYVADFPNSDTVYFAAARVIRNIGDADGADTARLATFVRTIEQMMDDAGAKGTATKYQRADAYYNMALRLVNRGVLIDDAARLASKSVPLLSEDDFMAKELAIHNERQNYYASTTPGRAADPFPRAESEEKWTGIRANHLSVLGRALLLQGHAPEAETRLRESYALAPVMETALALSSLREKAGMLNDALDFAVAAQLSGKMTAPEFAQLDAIYKKTHNGSLDGLEALLDKTYAAKHVNPITTTKYVPTPARTSRTVLAEMFTGGACIPCVSVDLSLEREVERYSRGELALLVYHIHAPTSDPYSNFSVEARSAYYGVHAAPTVLLDGATAPIGEGGGPLATTIFPKLDAAIGTRLEAAAHGRIDVDATRSGDVVQVQVRVPDAPSASTVRLFTVLVETTSSYSGENGLRVQPMVVRAIQGKGQGTALPLPGPAMLWPIDLKALAADNLAYYDWYIGDLKKRANIDASFREKRNAVDPSHLAVVAFLQDDVTHEVLQSVFVPIK